ncbi:16923_t:CDS:2, partial [Racocetra persica]
FFDHRNVSFVGRPFPLEEVHEHFSRLRTWGLTFVRLLVTWEALEHAGPGIYDEEFIDYLINIISEMSRYEESESDETEATSESIEISGAVEAEGLRVDVSMLISNRQKG